LGIRVAKAATAEEASRRMHNRAKSKLVHQHEIRAIIQDLRNLLARIEDAVPLINLALTTSGASLSAALPHSVSPSRMLQASTLLTAADARYSMDPGTPIQVGPAFTLSLYMLFGGYHRGDLKLKYPVTAVKKELAAKEDAAKGRILEEGSTKENAAKETTFKEVIHKARVKLMRIPLQSRHQDMFRCTSEPILQPIEGTDERPTMMTGEHKRNEYCYRLEIIEDLDDDRVHDFEDGPQPDSYGGVRLAGIKEFLPVYQISRIFYADTGKVLGIGDPEERHNAVLLLRRDINAKAPRKTMEENEKDTFLYDDPEAQEVSESESESEDDTQDVIDEQIRRESSPTIVKEVVHEVQSPVDQAWRLPTYLDTEWLALEVYTEPEDSSSEDEQNVDDDLAYASYRPSSSGDAQNDDSLIDGLESLHLNQESSVAPASGRQITSSPPNFRSSSPAILPQASIRTSLSLLEMLLRLTMAQQFEQASHLSIHDEILNFFLHEASTTGAGADADLRKRTRRDAVRKMGFDPYDESPIKQRGEDYQNQYQGPQEYEGDWDVYNREHAPYEEPNQHNGYPSPQQGWSRDQNSKTPEPWLLRNREHSSVSRRSPSNMPMPSSSPTSPYRPQRKSTRPLDRVQGSLGTKGSPLGRGVSVETDSTLGTSPGSPTLMGRGDKN